MVWNLGSNSWTCNTDQEVQNRNQKRDFQLNVEIRMVLILIFLVVNLLSHHHDRALSAQTVASPGL